MRRIGSRVAGWMVVAAVTAMLSSVSMSFAAVVNDEVTSVKLKEADGTSGQNTNSGSGVKTGHIQNGAVTDAKIVDGAVTVTKIANGAVTDAKISGTIDGSKLGAHGHNASDIVGTINAASLPVGTTSGTVAAGDHSHDSIYQKKYANVVVVAKSGGDYSDIYEAIQAANAIASQNGSVLVKVMPGTYSSQPSALTLRNGVHLEGSGTQATVISCSTYLGPCLATADYGPYGIRDLTVNVVGELGEASGIMVTDTFGTTISNVAVNVSNGYSKNIGIVVTNYGKTVLNNVDIKVLSTHGETSNGIESWGPPLRSVIMNNVNIDAKDFGIKTIGTENPETQYTLNNVNINASGSNGVGIYTSNNTEVVNSNIGGKYFGIMSYGNPSGSPRITVRNSKASGIYFYGNAISRISFTQIDGIISAPLPNNICLNVYDANLNIIGCQ